MENEIHCPKCGSTQITANKKGFSGKKAVVGALLTGGTLGLLAGTLGSKQMIITCLNCGNEFKPGIQKVIQPKVKPTQKPVTKKQLIAMRRFTIISLVISVIVTIITASIGGFSDSIIPLLFSIVFFIVTYTATQGLKKLKQDGEMEKQNSAMEMEAKRKEIDALIQ